MALLATKGSAFAPQRQTGALLVPCVRVDAGRGVCEAQPARAAARSHRTRATSGQEGGDKPSPFGQQSNISGISVNGWSPTSMQGWSQVRKALTDADVKIVSQQEVVFAMERGVPIIDVRPEDAYEKSHIPGAANVPLYQPIQGWEPAKIVRRAGFALFGVLNGTEGNPNFVQDAGALVSPEKGAIVYCALGGSLESTEHSKRGQQSRSIIAAYQLVAAGYKNIQVMKGGFTEWAKSGRDVEQFVDA